MYLLCLALMRRRSGLRLRGTRLMGAYTSHLKVDTVTLSDLIRALENSIRLISGNITSGTPHPHPRFITEECTWGRAVLVTMANCTVWTNQTAVKYGMSHQTAASSPHRRFPQRKARYTSPRTVNTVEFTASISIAQRHGILRLSRVALPGDTSCRVLRYLMTGCSSAMMVVCCIL